MSAFDPAFGDLPERIPIFPLSGVLLLPRGELPLNIFEPRYLEMFDAALAGNRMIGMIQPTGEQDEVAAPPVYGTGCAGRLVSFTESEDGRYLVTLAGLIRFDVEGIGSLQLSAGGAGLRPFPERPVGRSPVHRPEQPAEGLEALFPEQCHRQRLGRNRGGRRRTRARSSTARNTRPATS